MSQPYKTIATVPDKQTAETLTSLLATWFGPHWGHSLNTENPEEWFIHMIPCRTAPNPNCLQETKAQYFCIGFLHAMKGDK